MVYDNIREIRVYDNIREVKVYDNIREVEVYDTLIFDDYLGHGRANRVPSACFLELECCL